MFHNLEKRTKRSQGRRFIEALVNLLAVPVCAGVALSVAAAGVLNDKSAVPTFRPVYELAVLPHPVRQKLEETRLGRVAEGRFSVAFGDCGQ